MIASLDRQAQPSTPRAVAGRTPDFRTIARRLGLQAWAADLHQVPVMVIDKGNLRNVPYKSLSPAAITRSTSTVTGLAGRLRGRRLPGAVGRPAGEDQLPRAGLVALGRSKGRGGGPALRPEKDLVHRDGLTLEITPPTAEDAYHGWWVSVYDRRLLDHAAGQRQRDGIDHRLQAGDRPLRRPDPG